MYGYNGCFHSVSHIKCGCNCFRRCIWQNLFQGENHKGYGIKPDSFRHRYRIIYDSLKNKETILTDINMVKYGITRYEGEVECYIRNEEVIKIAKEEQITRAAAAMRYAAANDFEGIVVSGNAPTAVFEAMDLYQKGEMNLKAIVGVPVGFVGAADSKEALHNSNIPNIIVEGPKGGTPIAVACVNSLIQHL